MKKIQFNVRLTQATVERIKMIRERFALESDAQAVAYAVNQCVNHRCWETEMDEIAEERVLPDSIAAPQISEKKGGIAVDWSKTCHHPPPARDRVGDKCLRCGQKWKE